MRQVILGGQDGLVNVLGILLGVATATQDARMVLIAGLAATFAESVSMAAVAFTSAQAEKQYYNAQLEKEKMEIREIPEIEREEVKLIFMRKGFSGRQLEGIVKKITSDEGKWLDVMMREELELTESEKTNPVEEAVVVGFSAVIGSLIPLFPFFLLKIQPALVASLMVSVLTLFLAGVVKTKFTTGNWLRNGIELAGIGMLAALTGYAIGLMLGAQPG
jgi:predicted membrane protein (TIGR00267 family)